MVITKEELEEIVDSSFTLEEFSSVSSDGRALLTRIPQNIHKELNIKKGDKLKWFINLQTKELKIIPIHDTISPKKA